MTSHETSVSASVSFSSILWNLIIFIFNFTSFIFTSQLSLINQLSSIQLYFYHSYVLKQSRYKACRSIYEARRLNLSWDLGGVTNSELIVKNTKRLFLVFLV